MSARLADFKLTVDIDERLLPRAARDLVELIGLQATLKLVEHYQGVPLCVPMNYNPDHILVRLVGHDAAIKLIEAYGREKIEIPRCVDAIREIRNHKIQNSDKSQRQLALEYGLCVRQIRNIQNGTDEDDLQDELF